MAAAGMKRTAASPPKTGYRDWIGWMFFVDLLDGLRLTLSYLFSPSITLQYPDREKWIPYPRFRGHHYLRSDSDGTTRCVACELCARICPCHCITVVPHTAADGERRPQVFDIDLARCLFCGLCEDACPVEAIALGQNYEFSQYTPAALRADIDQLASMPGKADRGGYVVAARLEAGNRISPTGSTEEGRHWWQQIRGMREKRDE